MLTQEQKTQFNDILGSLGDSLDITQAQFEAAVKSYRAVGDWLSKSESSLAPYKPVIRPQGSFMLGTMIRPVNEEDDLDIDLVCELTGKNPNWTQFDLKQKVGARIRDNEIYRKMLQPEEGRRCWTLQYSDAANYHMDILPSIVNSGYTTVLESFSASSATTLDYDSLAIRITDNLEANYKTERNINFWMKSNPFGYGQWFIRRASLGERRTVMLSESVKPVPSYRKEKLPLQRVVQILKRHRDIMFNGNEDKPISIIITTLAARAYQGEDSITDALQTVIAHMKDYIKEKYDPASRKMIKVIENPVNPEENFADKWVEHPQREANFFKWLEKVRSDVYHMTQQRGLHIIGEAMKQPFGERTVTNAFSSLADASRISRESGTLKMAAGTGILGSVGAVAAKAHNFHGRN
jgi:hypothetical protein